MRARLFQVILPVGLSNVLTEGYPVLKKRANLRSEPITRRLSFDLLAVESARQQATPFPSDARAYVIGYVGDVHRGRLRRREQVGPDDPLQLVGKGPLK